LFIFEHSVDWSGRCETPAGEGGTGDPTGAKAPRRLPDSPAESVHLERKSTVNLNKAYFFEISKSCITRAEQRKNYPLKGVMRMEKDNQYVAADLSPNLVSEIKSVEEKLSRQSEKDVIVIAYERERNE